LTCVAGSAVAKLAHLSLIAQTGAEVVAGSTRLKAGTATKMILNMLSTGVMVKLGNTYGNLMVNVQPTNQKLQARAVNLVASIAGIEPESAGALLHEAGSVKTAVVMRRLKVSREDAELRLAQAGGRLGAALSTLA
jgi:N-acetylmuramic acid 6-phosphate etherase